MSLNIRKATLDDIPRVAQIEEICFPPEEAATLEKFYWRFENYPNGLLVAELDKEVIGAINMLPMESSLICDEVYAITTPPSGTTGGILSVITHPDYQNQGVAAMLMEAAIENAKALGLKTMALTCKEKLVHYYAKFGFEDKGVSDSVHGGAVWYDMTRDL